MIWSEFLIENGVVKPDTLDRFYISNHNKLDKFGKEVKAMGGLAWMVQL